MIEIRALVYMRFLETNILIRVFCEDENTFWLYARRLGAVTAYGTAMIYPNKGDSTVIPLSKIDRTVIIV